jgi:hypothetical protein
MKQKAVSSRSNARIARQLWGQLPGVAFRSLRELTEKYSLSVAAGDLQFLNSRWYVTHSGLLQLATRRGCRGITTSLQERCSDPVAGRWVFRATVYKSAAHKGFVGYGDADPTNVSSVVRGAEMRIAETRAVNRALRKAYGIGICSIEELGLLAGSPSAVTSCSQPVNQQPQNGSNNGHPSLKDKLCLLIRQHNLDPTLVKAYAAHFCGTETLRGASRELVGSFITRLENEALEDRDRLVCKLNSFSHPVEVAS